jgi:DnaJ-class molecular chaperone
MLNYNIIKHAIKVFNLGQNFNISEVKQKYKEFAIKYHPDKSQSNSEEFKVVTNLYNALKTYQNPYKIESGIYYYNATITLETALNGGKVSINGKDILVPNKVSDREVIYASDKSVIYTNIKKHKQYKRSNDDLLIELSVCSLLAITGTTINFEYLDGSTISLVIPCLTKHNSVFEFKNKGLKNGSLFVKVLIDTNLNLTSEQISQIKRILSK